MGTLASPPHVVRTPGLDGLATRDRRSRHVLDAVGEDVTHRCPAATAATHAAVDAHVVPLAPAPKHLAHDAASRQMASHVGAPLAAV